MRITNEISNKNKVLNSMKLKSRKEYLKERINKKIIEISYFLQLSIQEITSTLLNTSTKKRIIYNIILLKVFNKINAHKLIQNKFSKSNLSITSQYPQILKTTKLNNRIKHDYAFNRNNLKLKVTPLKQSTERYEPLNKKPQKCYQLKPQLPIVEIFPLLMKAIDLYESLIVIAETGAGKTTQIPKYLFLLGYSSLGIIGVTQPRRIATINVAKRVSFEMNLNLGTRVGYSIRFEDCTSSNTALKFMTDGILLREILNEPLLLSYSVVLLDEAHERTVFTDLLFSLLKDLILVRRDFKLIVCSATINTNKFSKFFNHAPLFQIPGRIFAVEVYYSKESEVDYLDAIVRTILQIHLRGFKGGILVFLTGQEDIEIVENILKKRTFQVKNMRYKLSIYPLFANLNFDAQNRVFLESINTRKIVLATNIAETSITISKITFVIDSGLCKIKYFDFSSKFESLIISPISKSSAWQRSGRAGRTAKGICFRLYTLETYKYILKKSIIPEIQRTNIDSLILLLKCLGVHNIKSFEFLDKPSYESILVGLEHLYLLGGLNEKGDLTKLGRSMSEFPLKPALSKIIIMSNAYNCTEEIIIICSIISLDGKFFVYTRENLKKTKNMHKKFTIIPKSDHLSLLNAFKEWVSADFSTKWADLNSINAKVLFKSRFVFEQLLGIFDKLNLLSLQINNKYDSYKIIKCLLSGLFMNSGYLLSHNTFRLLGSSMAVSLHPSSLLLDYNPKWIIFQDLLLTNKEFVSTITEIKCSWLIKTAPLFYLLGKNK
mmetsp:Transcript_13459/g.18644  ORF Transcript_13459/g.18644 Transcript_13459/m.18644 type:complete len:776 (-) Transcript_13459:861-3188(-)